MLKFCYMMLIRRAFLDGRAGITYAVLQSVYEYFIVLKVRELKGRTIAAPAEFNPARTGPDSASRSPDSVAIPKRVWS